MPIDLTTIYIALLVCVGIFAGGLAFGIFQMPTPRMRTRRNARLAHR